MEDILKADVRKQYFSEHFQWLSSVHCDACINDYVSCKVNGDEWKMKPCCQNRLKFDKRTPGLFKLEFQGDSIIALCSKAYICVNDSQTKIAHKGVSTAQNNFRFNHYKKVLHDSTQMVTCNTDIMPHNRKLKSYKQFKVGLISVYNKRKVCDHGFPTEPLDL